MRTSLSVSGQSSSFGTPIHFGVASDRRGAASAQLHQLKNQLLRPLLAQTHEPALRERLRLAANEALADASRRPGPALVLPCLLAQKVRDIHEWVRRQREIRNATRCLFRQWEAAFKNDSDFPCLAHQ